MADSSPPFYEQSLLRKWLGVNSYLVDIAGAVGLIVTLLLHLFSWPLPMVAFCGGISLGVLIVGIVAGVSVSNNSPVTTLGDLRVDHKALREDQLGSPMSPPPVVPKVRLLRESQPAIPGRDVELGCLECHVSDEDTKQHLLGATVIAQNEHTKREYSGVTNRDGWLALNVPCGYYAVTIRADRHKPRTDAARVVSADQKGFLDVSIQMDESGRWLHNYNIRKDAIEELGQLSKEGSALLKEAHGNPNAEVQERTNGKLKLGTV
jgi:hypothetical protein